MSKNNSLLFLAFFKTDTKTLHCLLYSWRIKIKVHTIQTFYRSDITNIILFGSDFDFLYINIDSSGRILIDISCGTFAILVSNHLKKGTECKKINFI